MYGGGFHLCSVVAKIGLLESNGLDTISAPLLISCDVAQIILSPNPWAIYLSKGYMATDLLGCWVD